MTIEEMRIACGTLTGWIDCSSSGVFIEREWAPGHICTVPARWKHSDGRLIHLLPEYLESLDVAIELVDVMKEKGFGFDMDTEPKFKYFATFMDLANNCKRFTESDESPSVAICKAFLTANSIDLKDSAVPAV